MTCYIIAEAGVAHEGSLADATRLLDTATEAGADAFKIQYFEKGMKGRNGSDMPWLEEEDVETLFNLCKDAGIDFIISPHDEWAINFIDRGYCDKFKIGSGDWHLLHISKRFLPRDTIISTGMHTNEEIFRMMNASHDMSFLHCVSEYPTTPDSARLWYMKQMMEEFPSHTIGYSDHTVGTAIPLAAVVMGAQIVEKHISLEKNVAGRFDTIVSLLHEEFIQFVRDIRSIEAAMKGPSVRQITLKEKETKRWVMESRGLTLDTWR